MENSSSLYNRPDFQDFTTCDCTLVTQVKMTPKIVILVWEKPKKSNFLLKARMWPGFSKIPISKIPKIDDRQNGHFGKIGIFAKYLKERLL